MDLKFSSDTKHRKGWFTGISFSHPAKMALPLQLWIIENYTKEEEVILDPMAGSGTIMVACSMGRNVICVELEDKFCKMMEGNWEKVKQRGAQMGHTMGDCQIINGDARNLEGILVDKCVFSPPYAEAQATIDDNYVAKHTTGGKLHTHHVSDNNIGNKPYGDIDKIIMSPPYGNPRDIDELSEKEYEDKRLGETDKQHGRTQFRGRYEVDKIVTSPDENMLGGLIAGEGSFFISIQRDERMKLGYQLHPSFSLDLVDSPADKLLVENTQKMFGCGKIRTRQDKRPQCQPMVEFSVSKLDDLVSKVIPLCNRIIPQSAKRLSFERWRELVLMMVRGEHLTEGGLAYIKERIANINNHHIDSVVFSPPYEGSIQPNPGLIEQKAKYYDKAGGRNRYREPRANVNQPGYETGYSDSQENIGNLKSDSYLEAMLQVYQSCYRVLKPGGLMILVTKNFIRNKQVIRLDLDTRALCEQADFTFIEEHHRVLQNQSFWRTIYHQKFPDVEQIDKENILVFKKA